MERQVREVLIVEIGGRRYGLPASHVRELVRAVAILPLPTDSAALEGVIDLRGAVVPVLDLRARLHLPPKDLQPSDHLIIIESAAGDRPIAVRVDRALELAALDPTAFERVQELEPGSHSASEVARVPDGLVPLLDLRSLIATARTIAIPPAVE